MRWHDAPIVAKCEYGSWRKKLNKNRWCYIHRQFLLFQFISWTSVCSRSRDILLTHWRTVICNCIDCIPRWWFSFATPCSFSSIPPWVHTQKNEALSISVWSSCGDNVCIVRFSLVHYQLLPTDKKSVLLYNKSEHHWERPNLQSNLPNHMKRRTSSKQSTFPHPFLRITILYSEIIAATSRSRLLFCLGKQQFLVLSTFSSSSSYSIVLLVFCYLGCSLILYVTRAEAFCFLLVRLSLHTHTF